MPTLRQLPRHMILSRKTYQRQRQRAETYPNRGSDAEFVRCPAPKRRLWTPCCGISFRVGTPRRTRVVAETTGLVLVLEHRGIGTVCGFAPIAFYILPLYRKPFWFPNKNTYASFCLSKQNIFD